MIVYLLGRLGRAALYGRIFMEKNGQYEKDHVKTKTVAVRITQDQHDFLRSKQPYSKGVSALVRKAIDDFIDKRIITEAVENLKEKIVKLEKDNEALRVKSDTVAIMAGGLTEAQRESLIEI